jgi:hypothetical protein
MSPKPLRYLIAILFDFFSPSKQAKPMGEISTSIRGEIARHSSDAASQTYKGKIYLPPASSGGIFHVADILTGNFRFTALDRIRKVMPICCNIKFKRSRVAYRARSFKLADMADC